MRLWLVVLLLTGRCAVAQEIFPYRNLVMEGAGIRGIAYAGALTELEHRGFLDSIERVGGTSAGAIVALAVALGYNASEITNIVYSTNFNRFNDGRYFFIGGIHRVRRSYGWYRGDEFTLWLGNIIKAKTGDADITLAELHQRGFRDLYVTGTSLTRQRLLVFSRETYPHMKIKDAVRASMSIPMYFEAVFIDSTGNVISKPKSTVNLDLVVDGGITGNYPVFLFDSTALVEGRIERYPNPRTMGIRIERDEQLEMDKESQELAPFEIADIKDYAAAFYAYTKENLNRCQLIPEDWERTVTIAEKGIGPRVRELSGAQKNALMESGRDAVRLFLSGKM